MESLSLNDFVFKKSHLKNNAIFFEGNKISYQDLQKCVDQFVKQLRSQSVQKGDLLVQWNTNCPFTIISLLAAEKLGLYFKQIGAKTPLIELTQILNKFKKVWVYRADQLIEMNSFETQTKFQTEMGLVLSTSGTSGNPSAIVRSFDSLNENAQYASEYQRMDSQTKSLVSLSMAHTGGMNMQTLPTLVSGGSLILDRNLGSYTFFKLQKEQPTHTILVPSQVRWYLKQQKETAYLYRGLHTVVTGSTSVYEEDWNILKKHFARVLNVYGLSEVGPFVMVAEDYKTPPRGADSYIGNPIQPYRCELVNAEIRVEGPCIGEKLGGKEEAHWLDTGDMAIQTEEGFFFCGRLSQSLEVAGHKFSSSEVEYLIQKHPSVESVAVVGVFHSLWGQIPEAYIVGNKNKKNELLSFLKERLSSFKIPRKFHYVQDLPRTEIEKVSYSDLRKNND